MNAASPSSERWRRFVDPAIVFLVLAVLWQNRMLLLSESWVTVQEVAIGFVLAVVGGVLLGLLIHAIPFVRRTLYPAIVVFQGLPKIALAPLMVIWFGYGLTSKVLMAFLFAFFPVVIQTMGGLASTPMNLIEHFQAIRAPAWVTFRRLQVPAALPSIIDGCRAAMPLAVIGAIVGEFVGSEDGLGHLILAANAQARTDLLFATLVVVSLVAGALYALVELAARRVWWRAF